MNRHTTYVRIVGEPFLSQAKAYREAQTRTLIAWSEFAKARGADEITGSFTGLVFRRGTPPEGWTAAGPRSRYTSRPKKGHPDADAMAALPRPPSKYEIFGDAICGGLSYEGPDCRGSSGIGYLFGTEIGWAGDTYVALIPDAEAAVRDHLATHPDHRITNGADLWRLPEGLIRMTEAEYRLLMAEHAVRAEREAA